MNFKAVILMSRRVDMTAEDFRQWWFDKHAPLAAQLPGVRRITFNLVNDATDVDGISELWFDTRSASDFRLATKGPNGPTAHKR